MKVLRKVAVMNAAGEWTTLNPGDDIPEDTQDWQVGWCVDHGFVEFDADEKKDE